MFTKQTIRDIDLKGKRVIVHGEFDAPLDADGKKVTSDFRINSAIPTIKYLQDQGCSIVLISKLGRPDGKVDPKQSLAPVAHRLAELLDHHVEFVTDCVGPEVQAAAAKLAPRQVLMLENLRFHPEEEENDQAFAQQIVDDTGAQVFVYDCFALAHRKEAGTDAITRCLPSVAGLHLAKEVETITEVMSKPEQPLAAIVGGAKIADKIIVLTKLMDLASFVAIGGAMANTFLAAKGVKIGKSKYDAGELDLAREIMAKADKKAKAGNFTLYLPEDGVVATGVDKDASTRLVSWGSNVVNEVQLYPKTPAASTQTVADDEMILDVGPLSAAFIAGGVQLARTVIWNGTLGVTEIKSPHGPVGPFAQGTEFVINALTGKFGSRPFSLVGGGDTVGYVEERDLTDGFSHVSTGGGASLELMAGRKLPGVEALLSK